MITHQQYLEALQVVKNYVYQLEQYSVVQQKVEDNAPLDKGSIVRYIGGSNSQFLTLNKEYELASREQEDSYTIFNDDEKRMRVKKHLFEKVSIKTEEIPLPDDACPICKTNSYTIQDSDGYICANCRTKF